MVVRVIITLLLLTVVASAQNPFLQHRRTASRPPPAVAGGSAPVQVDSTTVDRDNNSDNPETWNATTSTLGTGGYVTISVAKFGSGDPSSVTFDGDALTLLISTNNTTDSNIRCYIYGRTLGAKAAGTYVCSVVGLAGQQFTGKCITYNGVHQTTSIGGVGVNQGTITGVTLDVASASTELVVDCLAFDDVVASAATVGGGQTQSWNNNSGDGNIDGAGSYETGAATTTMSWTLSVACSWAQCGVALKPQ